MRELDGRMIRWWILLRYDWPLHFVLLLTNWLPDNVFFLRLRGMLSRPFFGSCGHSLNVGRNVTFHNPSMIYLGNFIHISYGCMLMAAERISIDDEVMFGPYCVVVSGKHTRAKDSYRFGPTELIPIRIGMGVWLGAHVVVTAGSIIGSGALVAAGAVVRGNIPDNVIAGGVPAHIIKASNE